MIIMRKKDIMKIFVLPSSRNGSNSNYHNKIYQHLGFGGLLGMVVQRYFYIDIDTIAKQMAALKMMEFRTRFAQ